MTEGKYIIYEDGSTEIFPDYENHDTHAKHHDSIPVSAGLFSNWNGKLKTFGESMTLHLQSNDEDVKVIQKAIDKMV